MQLFDTDEFIEKEKVNESTPLAERMRSKDLSYFFGQEHICSENGLLKSVLKNNSIFSMILWGPPGSGKTTLAKIIAKSTNAEFFNINAISSNVKELRSIIARAKTLSMSNTKSILFIDEIHRFNKSQQDVLLSSVEDGTIFLIGATTENPSFQVNSALISRCKVLVLKSLSKEDLNHIFSNALNNDIFLAKKNILIADKIKNIIIELAGGDARKMLNLLELSINIAEGINPDKIIITDKIIKSALIGNANRYDKNGDYHYDIISAFIKSIRGSDPDGSVYWLARMLNGGEKPEFIARRLVILASEDIGNASPNGLVLAQAGFDAVSKIGMPESRIILAQVATYLASQPKSNSSYKAISSALEEVEKSGDNLEVPIHLRNAPTKIMKDLNYGKEYKYSHDYEDNFVIQQYLPDSIKNKQFYIPTENGIEKGIKERLKKIWNKIKNY